MPFTVNFSKQAFKELEKINEPFYSNIKQAIHKLADDLRPHGYFKLKVRDGYRIRIGDYRVIYDSLDKELIIGVITVGTGGTFTIRFFAIVTTHGSRPLQKLYL